MAKKIVDLTITEIPAGQNEVKQPKKNVMPGDASHYKGKKSGKTLTCINDGNPRKRGTQLCPQCINSYITENEIQHEKYKRKD